MYSLYSIKNLTYILNTNYKLIKSFDKKIKDIAKDCNNYICNSDDSPKCDIKKIKGKNIYIVNEIENKVFLKALEYRLKKFYKIKIMHKNDIIRSIRNIFKEENIKVIKTDIENFYESINLKTLLQKIKRDRVLSDVEFNFFKKIMDSCQIDYLPRGFSISPLLAEIYMKSFDSKIIQNYKNIFYYARYVDDIIIFYYGELKIDDIKLPDNLTFNQSKTENNINDFEYLGYHFKDKKDILLSKKKIKKIKTRLLLSIHGFEKDKDEKLLEDRIKFLTTNWKVKKNSRLYNGIYYNNMFITDSKDLVKLDQFLQSIYKCKYFFKRGFDKKILTTDFNNTFDDIKKIWCKYGK